MNWTEPKSYSEWFQRLISVRALMMSMFFLVLFVSELRFDWIEQTIGSYLVSTNGARPESGAIWEVGKQTRSAQQAIDKIVSDRQFPPRSTHRSTKARHIRIPVRPWRAVWEWPTRAPARVSAASGALFRVARRLWICVGV